MESKYNSNSKNSIDVEKEQTSTLLARPKAREITKLSDFEKIKQKIGNFFSFANHVTIPDDHHGVVLEFKRFKKVLAPGQHSHNITEDITIFEDIFIPEDHFGIKTINKQFDCILKTGQYFVNQALNEAVIVKALTVVPENYKGVLTQYGKFKSVLEPGKYPVNVLIFEALNCVKLIVIPENFKGVVTTYGKFTKCLPPGDHFINELLGEVVQIVAEIVVEEDEQGLLTVNGQFKGVIAPGGKCFANPILNEKIVKRKLITVQEGHVGIKTIRGVFQEQLPPGIYFENPYLFEKIVLVNMQLLTKELKPVSIMSRDTVKIPAVMSILVYRIVDAKKAICEVEDIDFAIRETIKTITHQVLSEHTLDSIMCDKIKLSNDIKDRVAQNSENWGVKVERIDIKDIAFNSELEEALSASARAQRLADSKLITAKAEVEAAVLFRQAADQLDSAAALQMRNLDALIQICKNQNTKVLFIPDMKQFGNNSSNNNVIERVLAKEIQQMDLIENKQQTEHMQSTKK